jgi:hypothetical protein
VFYQTSAGKIEEVRFDKAWSNTGFGQYNTMPGTDMAVVCTSNADLVMLFFQDSDGYLCHRYTLLPFFRLL